MKKVKDRLEEMHVDIAKQCFYMIPGDVDVSELIVQCEVVNEKLFNVGFNFKETGSGVWIYSYEITKWYDFPQNIYDQLRLELGEKFYKLYHFFKENQLPLWEGFELKIVGEGKYKGYEPCYRFSDDELYYATKGLIAAYLADDEEQLKRGMEVVDDYFLKNGHVVH